MFQTPGGYLHPDYADSLRFFGHPWPLEQSEGWLLRRQIEGTPYFDAMGCYPLFTCKHWDRLPTDMTNLPPEWVSVFVVTDPLASFDEKLLRQSFPDVCYPYKQHMLVDLSQSPEKFVHSHHQRYARWALKRVKVDLCSPRQGIIDTWCQLYRHLCTKHGIKGIPRFSRAAFQQQLSLPGTVVFKATANQETIGILIWYQMGTDAYYHLGASNADGYKSRASFALFWESIGYFAEQGVKRLSLGAGAGWQNDRRGGLTRFKSGWSNACRTAYFCGKIIDRKKYQDLSQRAPIVSPEFFPLYRFAEWETNDHHH